MNTPAGRTNVVFGAASGMGAATAEILGRRGRLLVVDKNEAALDEVATRLGDHVEPIVCDVTSSAEVDALVRATGELGSLVVTAGLSPAMASGREIYEVNLVGMDRVVRSFERALVPGSAAVLFASMAAHMMTPDPALDEILDAPRATDLYERLEQAGIDPEQPQFAYALSKRGVVRMARRHAAAWAAHGARLLSLSPGIVDTGMGRLEAEHEPSMATMVETSPIARMAAPEEVARVAAFLVSDDASFMTATDVLVDGGCVAGAGMAR